MISTKGVLFTILI